ncbi:MAG: hypothetical protein ACLTYW_00325 [Collinsella sp.]
MNDKYFDGNLFEELPADHFHKKVLDHATCIAANLMFDAAHPDHTGGVKSANAYHMMIALCEAGSRSSTRRTWQRAASSSPR